MNVHRFHHDIGGRPYHIEVTPVGNKWRAQLRRMAGMPTALMPFYGSTPEEAADLLTRWLVLAHSRPTSQTGRPAGPTGHDLVAGSPPVR
ncbi:MAG TPA: hypothetical protein VFP16_07700 [Vicinamibacterales bacterium]|nr:hypothetical protein [Vicinamibacterales bacterium]